MLAIFLPICYVIGLLVFLYLAGTLIRGKPKDSFDHSLKGNYFPVHREKLEYEELSEQYSPDDPNGSRVLHVALMKRAMETVRRVLRLREEKPPLQQMVRDGVIGENLWEKLLAAEADIESEIQEVRAFAKI